MSDSDRPAFRGFTTAPARAVPHHRFRGFLTPADTVAPATAVCDVPGCHAPDHRLAASA
jgi:hypothetical protein